MGKKYIIEIPENKIADFVGSTHFLMPYMMAGHIGHHDTGLPIKPYTEPDLEQVRKEAYEEGLKDGQAVAVANEQNNAFNDGYKKCLKDMEHVRKEAYERGYYIGYSKYLNKSYEDGLKDAWEAARKIANLVSGEQKRLFDCFGIYSVAHKFSAAEAIEKLKTYEQEQEQKEIKVGDEVVGVFSDGKETRPFVFMRGTQEYYFGMYSDTEEFCRTVRLNLRKTGRHFPEIAAVLEKMRGGQE